jgi:hypothetical protein
MLLFVSLIACLAFGQDESDFRHEMEPEIPYFIYDCAVTPIAERDSVSIDIVIQVPFNTIQFIKKDSIFIGKYEISLMLLDERRLMSSVKSGRRLSKPEISPRPIPRKFLMLAN